MSSNHTYTVERSLQLSQDALAAIRQLVAACEAEEPAPVRISWKMLQARPGDAPLDFCCYLDGALVGYLFMDHYDPKERETIILVHPAYRRRGIGLALLAEAREACRQTDVERMVLLCERRATSGQAFIEHVGARFDFAEHEMGLGEFQPRAAQSAHLSVRPAELDDFDALTSIQASSFGDPEDQVRERLTQHWQNQDSSIYIATLPSEQHAQAEPVGMFRLTTEDHEIGIYGLGIASAYQRHGYGRQMVEEAIRIARSADAQTAVMLDVDVNNARAFPLYVSCGFQVRATYDYYVLGINE